MVVDRGAQAPLKKWGKQELEAGHSIRYRTSYPNRAAGTPSFVIILYFLSMAIPHNSKCRYGERGEAAAKPKAQIILDVLSSILATQMP